MTRPTQPTGRPYRDMALPSTNRDRSLPRPSSASMDSMPDESPKRCTTRLLSATASQPSTSSAPPSSHEMTTQPPVSARILQAMEQYPKGMVLVSQGNPRTQAVVVGHMPSATGAPLIQLFQVGFTRPQTGDWNPPGLADRLVNKLPQQELPPTVIFMELDKVRSHLARLYRHTASLEATDVEPLVTHLEQARRQQGPGLATRSNHSSTNMTIVEANGVHQPFTAATETSLGVQDDANGHLNPYTSAISSMDLHNPTHQMNELTRRMAELDTFLRADRRSQHPPSMQQTQPPLLPSPPGFHHDAISSRHSSRTNSHSRSRSRSRDRSLVHLRKYALINVPCPFSDLRAAIPPASRASGSARQRRFFRRILTDIYVFYPSALLLAQHIIALNRQTGSTILTWEEATLLHWARALDYTLLEANGGSWTLWSEPVVDCLLRGFLEMAIRANPDHEPPPGLDPSTAAKLRRLKFGKSRDYGPLPRNQTGGQANTGNNNNQRQRRNNFHYRGNDRTAQFNQQTAGHNTSTGTTPPFQGGPRRPPNPPAQ